MMLGSYFLFYQTLFLIRLCGHLDLFSRAFMRCHISKLYNRTCRKHWLHIFLLRIVVRLLFMILLFTKKNHSIPLRFIIFFSVLGLYWLSGRISQLPRASLPIIICCPICWLLNITFCFFFIFILKVLSDYFLDNYN